MNEERTELWLWQTEHICFHLWHRYSVTVKEVVMVATIKLSNDDFNFTIRNPCFSSLLLCSNAIKEFMIGTNRTRISDQLRYLYSICRWCWNVITYKWKVHNLKIEIISFVVAAPYCQFLCVCQCIEQT
jgi:hypothetical protein